MSDIDPQEFGAMRADMRNVQSGMQQLVASVAAIEKQLAEAKGGWRMLVWVGGAIGAFGSAAGWFLHEVLRR